MPVVPNSVSVDPITIGANTVNSQSNEDKHNARLFQQNFGFNEILANVSEEQLEEITHTLHVNMVSESIDNINDLSSQSSSSCAVNNHNNNNTNSNNMSTNLVCGVVVVDERVSSTNPQHNPICEPIYKNSIILGSVVLEKSSNSCEELRRSLQTQIPCIMELQQKYSFLTKEGWPVLRPQENKVKIFHIIGQNNCITLRKSFDKPRLGIVNTTGECFGFIFVQYYWNLRQLRDTIDEHFKEIGLKNQKIEYTFIEKNGWPVATNQEIILLVLDIVVNHNICIQSGSIKISSIASNAITAKETPQLYALPAIKYKPNEDYIPSNTQKTFDLSQIDSGVPIAQDKSAKRSSKKISYSVSRTQTTRSKSIKVSRVKSGKTKPIMLSYARQEAAQHALELKELLVSLGFSVYLDVHEIKTGSDWQDSLNDAVRGCEVFVPLVTPMYGKTQWTNREVKLADILRKYIIPINFLDTWPPECLAIQFATTQYIPWMPAESEHEAPISQSVVDIKNWPKEFKQRVTQRIADYIQKNIPDSEPKNAILSSPVKASVQEINELDGQTNVDTNKTLVVISAHPQQKSVVNQIKSILSDEYNIWCSTDLPEGGLVEEDLINNSPPFTPNHALSPIAEDSETTFNEFNEKYKGLARNIVEKIKQRPKSMPLNPENFTFEPRKGLTRMLSQTSENSHLSSLTPDKIDRLKVFEEQVRNAGVVIIVASETYYNSGTSKQHVFYCERRKKTLLVRCDLTPTPSWFSMLMDQDAVSIKNPLFDEVLKSRVKRTLSKAPTDEMHESKMQYLVSFMKKNLPLLETCVYVVGSTKLQRPRSEEICRAIGSELAKVKNVNVVTSGFFGAGDIVAKSFHESRQSVCQSLSGLIEAQQYNCKPDNTPNSFESSVVHIVPLKDSEDFSTKCRQNSDGSFEPIPYGKTMFLGESVKERESAVARLFDTCILIEGGPGSAHEIEEFIWNDHFVIPIISSGGAASGEYEVSQKIFACPHGVDEQDWDLLSAPEATPLEVAKAVVRIIVGLKKAIASHALSRLHAPLKAKNKFMRKKSTTKKKLGTKRKVNIAAANAAMEMQDRDPNSPDKVLPVIESIIEENETNIENKSSKWKRMQKLMTFSSKKC